MQNYLLLLEDMKDESKKMAKEYRIYSGQRNGEIDAFRHAYISAKITRDKGAAYSRIMGTANELRTEISNRFNTFGIKGNPPEEWEMDEYNNKIGREIGILAKEENWSDDEIAVAVRNNIKSGRLKTLVGTLSKKWNKPKVK